jgi:hypothetical protein
MGEDLAHLTGEQDQPALPQPETTPDSANAPAAADDATSSTPRAKPEPVSSLVDLYTVKGANAAKLLRELEKESSWKFADDDVETALGLIPERDANLARTRQLLHEAIDTREGRFARAAGDFALRALESDLAGAEGWPPGDDTQPVDALEELADKLAADLKDPKRQRRAHNVLMIGVDLLSNRRAVAFELVAPVLRQALGTPTTDSKRNPRRHRTASVTLPRNGIERVRDLLDLLEPWEQEVAASENAVAAASAGAREASMAAERAQESARELGAELASATTELERLRQEAESARDQAQDVRIHASADVSELRACSIAFLNTRLRDLLATAKEANELDPPRTATALRLLDQAMQELQKEVEWLRSSA